MYSIADGPLVPFAIVKSGLNHVSLGKRLRPDPFVRVFRRVYIPFHVERATFEDGGDNGSVTCS